MKPDHFRELVAYDRWALASEGDLELVEDEDLVTSEDGEQELAEDDPEGIVVGAVVVVLEE